METNESISLIENFKNRISQSIKENLILSILSTLWLQFLENQNFTLSEKENFKKDFIKNWKSNIINITQNELKKFNETLNNENADIINIISGKNIVPDIEDYQKIINECLLDIEKIYLQISERDK